MTDAQTPGARTDGKASGRRGLKPREQAALDHIRESIATRGYPPSMGELCAATGLAARSSVLNVLRRLEAKGYIARDPGRHRAIRLLDPEPQP